MTPEEMCLNEAEPGQAVEFRRFDAALATVLQDQFLSYGMAPGRPLRVLQQHPLTVVLCDHTEIAVETAVARSIIVAPRSTAD